MADVGLDHPARQPQFDQLVGRVEVRVEQRGDDGHRDRAEAVAPDGASDLAHGNRFGQGLPVRPAHPRRLARRFEVLHALVVLALHLQHTRAGLSGASAALAFVRMRVRPAGREVDDAQVMRRYDRVQFRP